MRMMCVKICCILVIFSLLTITEVDAKKSKKKKPSEDDLSKDESNSAESTTKASSDLNPKTKPLQTRPAKKKEKTKVQAEEAPVITKETLVEQKREPPGVTGNKENTEGSQANNCSPAADTSNPLVEIEKNVTALWSRVNAQSQPVHIHVHGGHVRSPNRHRHHDCIGHCHGDGSPRGRQASGDKFKTWNKTRSHDHSHNHTSLHHSKKGYPAVNDHDKSLSNRNKSDSDKSHGHFHRGHGHSHGGHDHGHGDHSYKSHNDSKGHSHGHSHRGHSPTKGHDFRRGYSDGEGRGHSTHVHIHLTIDEKPDMFHSARRHPDVSKKPPADEHVYARCDIRSYDTNNNLIGYVLLRQTSLDSLEVKINISGFSVPPPGNVATPTESSTGGGNTTRNLRGFHVHEYGDFSQGCASFGGHYNPEGTVHGGFSHDVRHVGDWGNIEVSDQGVAISYFSVSDSTLRGPHSILGRGIVVHGQPDDLGEGGTEVSRASGSAGARLGCCIIGQTKPVPEVWTDSKPT